MTSDQPTCWGLIGSLIVMLTLVGRGPAWSADVLAKVLESIGAKGWVTSTGGPERTGGQLKYEIRTRLGEHERVIYISRPLDVAFGRPALSPQGDRVAFVKTVPKNLPWREGNPVRWIIAVMDMDGTNYQEVFELAQVSTFSRLAWSPDLRRLALVGIREAGRLELLVLDLTTQPATVLLARPLGPANPRPFEGNLSELTNQAWAPDSRRLVYGNAAFHMILLDTTTGTEENLGPGSHPTWSRDGTRIAYAERTVGKKGLGDDYLVLPLTSPRQPTRIIETRYSVLGWQRNHGYIGPPLWSPDDQFLLVVREELTDFEKAYVADVSTGEVVRLPDSLGRIDSWGGKP
jgi:Tol biopolymer transport system component